MADELVTTQSDPGAGVTTQTEVAVPTSQEAVQSQESEQPEVGQIGNTASSEGKQGRKGNWATERIVERAIKKQFGDLESRIAALIQKQQPPVPAQQDTSQDILGDPNYNDLNTWLKQAVGKLLQQKLAESLPQHLDQFKGELRNVSKTQEARNYLISQPDIGQNEDKHDEIMQVMKDNLLDSAAIDRPLKAIQKAIEIWRRGKVNPNAPTRDQLSTVSGGTGITAGKKNFSIDELKALQMKIANGLTKDEEEKVFAQVDSLLAE